MAILKAVALNIVVSVAVMATGHAYFYYFG
jgi:hypothetical protein